MMLASYEKWKNEDFLEAMSNPIIRYEYIK